MRQDAFSVRSGPTDITFSLAGDATISSIANKRGASGHGRLVQCAATTEQVGIVGEFAQPPGVGGAVPFGHAHGSVQHHIDRAGRNVRQEFLRQNRDAGARVGERTVAMAATQRRDRHAADGSDPFRELGECEW